MGAGSLAAGRGSGLAVLKSGENAETGFEEEDDESALSGRTWRASREKPKAEWKLGKSGRVGLR